MELKILFSVLPKIMQEKVITAEYFEKSDLWSLEELEAYRVWVSQLTEETDSIHSEKELREYEKNGYVMVKDWNTGEWIKKNMLGNHSFWLKYRYPLLKRKYCRIFELCEDCINTTLDLEGNIRVKTHDKNLSCENWSIEQNGSEQEI